MATEPINAGPAARLLTICAVKLLNNKLLSRLRAPSVGLPSIFGLCFKTRSMGDLREGHALKFISECTSIPVPKVYCAFVYHGRVYLVMGKIKGKMLYDGWQSRSAKSKEKILEQLRAFVQEMRSVPVPSGIAVASCAGGPVDDDRLPSNVNGTYTGVREFHEALVNDADLNKTEKLTPAVSELFAFYRQYADGSVLTHGDLSSLNIMVEGDTISGILDWEYAGWFPAYWEYVCAKQVNNRNKAWAEEVDKFLTPMPEALRMNQIRQVHFSI